MPAFDIIVRRRNANNNGTEEVTVPYVAGNPIAFDAEGDPVSGGGTLKVASVTLTNAQILALPTTPIALVAAVVGKVLVPVSAVIKTVIAASGAYTGVDTPSDVGLVYGEETDLLTEVDADDAGILDTEGTNIVALAPVANAVLLPAEAINLFSANAADYEDGNAANSLRVTVWYVELDA